MACWYVCASTSEQRMNDPITWKRLKAIFDNPKPVEHVWQHQFDYDDGKLKELALTKHEEIDFGDMWYYHHDLAYMELQPELFKYLFPVCLMDWHQSLSANESCSHGDSEFHHGIIHGNVLDKMLTPTRRRQSSLRRQYALPTPPRAILGLGPSPFDCLRLDSPPQFPRPVFRPAPRDLAAMVEG